MEPGSLGVVLRLSLATYVPFVRCSGVVEEKIHISKTTQSSLSVLSVSGPPSGSRNPGGATDS